MSKIDIQGLDKAELLAALCNAPGGKANGITLHGARSLVALRVRRGGRLRLYFDYVGPRVLRCDLGADEMDPHGYDRENGDGAAKAVVVALRRSNMRCVTSDDAADWTPVK